MSFEFSPQQIPVQKNIDNSKRILPNLEMLSVSELEQRKTGLEAYIKMMPNMSSAQEAEVRRIEEQLRKINDNPVLH